MFVVCNARHLNTCKPEMRHEALCGVVQVTDGPKGECVYCVAHAVSACVCVCSHLRVSPHEDVHVCVDECVCV